MQIIHVLDNDGIITYIGEDVYQSMKDAGGAPFDAFQEQGYEEVFLKDSVNVRDYIRSRQLVANLTHLGKILQHIYRKDLAEARRFIADAIEPDEGE